MNKLTVKIIAFALCATLCLSGAVTAFALTENKKEEPQKVNTTVYTEKKENEITKDETVYVLATADGSVKKIIVSDWIKNALGASSLTDTTRLSDIKNVKGDESYTISGNAKVWDAQGNDIYYQGNIEKELPVGLTVTYKLDGKTVSAEEIAGKSGKVSIRFDYNNRQVERVKIDGKDEEIYVPFAMLTGMLLDNGKFRNVEVTNGKLINDGDRTAVVGIALPGLQENLGIGKEKIDIPDYVEITADASDFSFGMTVTIATNELFNNLDTSKLDSVGGLTDSIGELKSGMQQLLDGSSALYGGICTLLQKSKELVSGINQLADGAKALKDGVIAANDGAGQLKVGAAELAGGLNTLKGNNATLNGGAKQVFETLLSTAETQLKAGGVQGIPTLTIENYASVFAGILLKIPPESESAKSISALKTSLDSYNAFYLGLITYTGGVASAADGAEKLVSGASDLKNGTEQLKDGTSSLYNGILELKNGTPALEEGVSKLKDGAMQLNDGLEKFNEDGIQKIVKLVDGDLNGIITRFKATVDVSKKYRNFSGISDDMDGQVKFVYRTDEIKAK